jgi:hypothetical protein
MIPNEFMAFHNFAAVSVTIELPLSTSVLSYGENKEDFCGNEE